MPETKELQFFDDPEGYFAMGIDAYARHFADAPPNAICGEFTPNYLFEPETSERIAALLPDTRLLVILRDPVERAWSHYWFSVNRGRELLSFEQALDREEERLNADRFSRGSFSYVARGRYLEQLRDFEAAFSREQLCVVLLEELKAQPAATMEIVCRHIGLDSREVDVPTDARVRNRTPHPRLRRLHYVTMKTRRWSEEQSVPVHTAVRVVTGVSKHLNRTTARPSIPNDVRRRLVEEFRPHNAALADWLGRPLPWQGVA